MKRQRIKIIEQKKFDWYWIGKAPKTKKAFIDWMNSDLTALEISKKYKIYEPNLYRHSVNLNKLGIIERIRTSLRDKK